MANPRYNTQTTRQKMLWVVDVWKMGGGMTRKMYASGSGMKKGRKKSSFLCC